MPCPTRWPRYSRASHLHPWTDLEAVTHKKRNRAPFGLLLGALILFLFLVPIVGETEAGKTIVSLGFTGILVAGLGVARQSSRFLLIAIVLIVANLVAQWVDQFIHADGSGSTVTRSLLGAAYFSYLVIALIRLLLHEREVSVDTILGGINVYLLIAIVFAQLHSVLECLSPGAYQQGGVALDQLPGAADGPPPATFLYFSFVTITTLGYGDVSPIIPVAEFLSVAEAVIGQLYIAILIGGLVALLISGRIDR